MPLIAGLVSACVVGEITGSSDDDPQPPPPPPARGLVSEPAHGKVLDGDPGRISLRVAGVYDTADTDLAVQVLANPNDLASWQTIATARSASGQGDRFAFSTDVTPGAQAARWPRGGVLRLRVVGTDGAALPYDATTPADTVLAVANPAGAPNAWTYLTEQPTGSINETQQYYAAINAPATLDDFIERFGFPGGEADAVYYNAGDLGIGREMHCRATGGGAVACYVRNFGEFGGSRTDAIAQLEAAGTPLATVAMVYTPPITAPNAVQFMVYGGDGALINEAQLDSKGNNVSIPQNCLNCHGGRSSYNADANAVLGARFLPFDPAAFAYSARPEFSFAAQESKFRELNRLVAAAAPAPAVRDVIDGMFPASGSYNAAWAPAAWRANPSDERVYHAAIAPFCRGCHVSFAANDADPLSLADPASLRTSAASLMPLLCGTDVRSMPAAEQTALQYFASPARAVLLTWLDAPGACAPL